MTDQEQGLKKELSARQMAMVAVGGSIGTGLLLGSGAAIQVAGPAVILTFVLSALISWTVAMALGEMSSVHPAAGSFGVYAELYVNRWAGFIARYGYWFSVVIAIGSEVVAAATYMRQWYPAVPALVWMVTFGLFLLAINLFSVGHYGTFEYWFALLKVVTIFVFIVMGAALLFVGKVHPQYLAQGGFAPKGWPAPLLAISFGLYSFLGIEMVAISSGEARSSKDVARATRIAFAMLAFIYVGAMAVLVGVMPWKNAGVSESPFVTVFKVAGIPAAGFMMNLVVLSAALSGANASLYVTSRMLFSLARSGYAPKRMGILNQHGVPMGALLASMLGIVAAILLQLRTANAYLYIINAALVGGMIAWLISLLAHVRFRQTISAEQLAEAGLRSPLGATGSILGFVAIVASIACTWWVSQSSVAAKSAGIYLVVLTAAYLLMPGKKAGRYLAQKKLPPPSPSPERVLKSAMDAPRTFLSYSWDSREHQQWVTEFAQRLQEKSGVEIIFDRWHLNPGDDKLHFMEQAVADSKFVIVVCTPTYAERANKRQGGVGYESMVITTELAEHILTNKFIPVLRKGTWTSSLPIYLKNRMGVNLSDEPYHEDEYERLLRVLHGEPIKPPHLGSKPDFSRKPVFKPSDVTDATRTLSEESSRIGSILGPPDKRPNAIAWAWYDKVGTSAPRESVYVRHWNIDGHKQYSFETTRGDEYLGTKDEVINRFFSFHRLLLKEGYKRMNFTPGPDPEFSVLA